MLKKLYAVGILFFVASSMKLIYVNMSTEIIIRVVATLPLGDLNTEAWSSGMGVGRGANNPTL
jgi:hypothetical protein